MAEPELFSIERFQDWTSRLILDNGENWKLAFQIESMEDLFNETWRGKLTGYLLVRGGVHQIDYAHGPRARLASLRAAVQANQETRRWTGSSWNLLGRGLIAPHRLLDIEIVTRMRSVRIHGLGSGALFSAVVRCSRARCDSVSAMSSSSSARAWRDSASCLSRSASARSAVTRSAARCALSSDVLRRECSLGLEP